MTWNKVGMQTPTHCKRVSPSGITSEEWQLGSATPPPPRTGYEHTGPTAGGWPSDQHRRLGEARRGARPNRGREPGQEAVALTEGTPLPEDPERGNED